MPTCRDCEHYDQGRTTGAFAKCNARTGSTEGLNSDSVEQCEMFRMVGRLYVRCYRCGQFVPKTRKFAPLCNRCARIIDNEREELLDPEVCAREAVLNFGRRGFVTE